MTKAKDGNNAVYAASKADLQYWYHVEKLSPTELQQRYLEEHGVFADRAYLVRWLHAPAQKLQQLDTNECIHSHACGEYVLDELQRGAAAIDVVDGLLRKYLVETTAQRVAAYRRYREQSGVYWTVKGLERVHWRPLYDQVHSMAFHGSILCHFLRFSDGRDSSMSFKTLLLTVIPKRYYCQSSVFQRNTKMVLLFKLLFPM